MDRFGVQTWEECTLGVHASHDGVFLCTWLILTPLRQDMPDFPLAAPSSQQDEAMQETEADQSPSASGLQDKLGSGTCSPPPALTKTEPPSPPHEPVANAEPSMGVAPLPVRPLQAYHLPAPLPHNPWAHVASSSVN